MAINIYILLKSRDCPTIAKQSSFFGYIIRGMVRNGGKKRQNGAVMAIAPGC